MIIQKSNPCKGWYYYQKQIPIFENVANLDKLPENKIYVIALPMKIKDGSGGPLRIIAKIL